MSKFVFITGGVMSSIGKGIAAASIGTLLQSRGFSIRLKKMDVYINLDPGTMSPYKHGEVYVMGDGCEADLDFGHYERFTNVSCSKDDLITTGKIYSTVLAKERAGDYLGSDIQVIPHITNEIKSFILEGSDAVDFTICEIGGTVGDIEGLPHIESLRQLKLELPHNSIAFVHLTYLPYIKTSGELKTKPTQHSVKSLQSLGVQPDILLCRAEHELSDDIRNKLSMFCNVRKENVIEALDASNIYLVPKMYHLAGLDTQICDHFGYEKRDCDQKIDEKWGKIEKIIISPPKTTRIAIVGKYTQLKDAYISLTQAIQHAGFANDAKVEIEWIDAEEPWADIEKKLQTVSGIIVPGGFGSRGTESKIRVIQYARENAVPFLGICLGMQLAVIESCRNIIGIKDATSREFSDSGTIVVDFMENWESEKETQIRHRGGDIGGTMRLGNYPCLVQRDTLAYRVYNQEHITERHRHRYEVNLNKYFEIFNKSGLVFSGTSMDGKLAEIMERRDHPFFIAVQFHPEFKSCPFAAHPLFVSFIEQSLSI